MHIIVKTDNITFSKEKRGFSVYNYYVFWPYIWVMSINDLKR